MVRNSGIGVLTLLVGMFFLSPCVSFAQFDKAGEWRDPATNLVWKRCSLGASWNGSTCVGEVTRFKFFGDIGKAIKSIPAADGWRLPEIHELASIVSCTNGFRAGIEVPLPNKTLKKIGDGCNDRSVSPAIKSDIFPNIGNGVYWSNTFTDDNKKYGVDFNRGFIVSDLLYNDFYGAIQVVRNGELTYIDNPRNPNFPVLLVREP